MTEDSWGPWVAHDGKSCPWGRLVQFLVYNDPTVRTTIAGAKGGQSWFWGDVSDRSTWSDSPQGSKAKPIVQYRLHQPKAMDLIKSWVEEPESVN